MIKSNPIDIPSKVIHRRKIVTPRVCHTIGACVSKSASYDSSNNTPFSGISLSPNIKSCSLEETQKSIIESHTPTNNTIIIEIHSPIYNYDTMSSFIQDAFPVLSVDDIDYILYRLDKVKIAKIKCSSNTDAIDSCSKLIQNGITAWVE